MGGAWIRGLFATARVVAYQAMILGMVAVAHGSALAQEVVPEVVQEVTSGSALESSDAVVEAADDDASVDKDVFVGKNSDFRLTRAGGWLVGVPSQGAVALFRAAGEPQAQIEVRVSENIVEDQRGAYFSAFHNGLLRVGFTQVEGKESSPYSGRVGQEYEYRVLSDGQEFRLVVWLYYRTSEAWIVTGFFPRSKRDVYYRGFQQMLRSLEFTD